MPPPPPPTAATAPVAAPVTVPQPVQAQISVDEYLEKSKPIKYIIGDLIWAKMTGHPYWPCMVTDDPLLRVHTKFTGNPIKRNSLKPWEDAHPDIIP